MRTQIANNLNKEILSLLRVREMQMKTTMSYKVIPIGLVKIKKLSNTECCQRCKEMEKFMHCL